MDNLIVKLYKSPKSVFTFADLAILWQETSRDNLKAKISYYVKKGSLHRLARGIYAKQKDFRIRELAASFYSPSYISFETVLRGAGVIFQHYSAIFVAGPWSLKRRVAGQSFVIRRLKSQLLYNPLGVLQRDSYSIATPERAFVDMVYLFPKYFFDHPDRLDWALCLEIAKTFGSRSLLEHVNKYRATYAQ